MIKMSLKTFAKYFCGNPHQQRKILRDLKHQDEENHAQIIYYRDAKQAIVAYHKNQHDPSWLLSRADHFRSLAQSHSGAKKTKYKNNALALAHYQKYFGKKDFTLLKEPKLTYQLGQVLITATPDLHVTEKSQNKIIKLNFAKDSLPPKGIKVISQLLFEAQRAANLGFASSQVLYADIHSGNIYKGARLGANYNKEIQAACQNIAAIWRSI